MKKGLLIVVSGPSGTGKGTVCGELLDSMPELAYSISATTRAPRAGEVDGKNYYFLTKERFEELIAEGGFLEYANVYGNYYGTPLVKIQERLAEGNDILLEIDTQGALEVMKKCPDAVSIFILPPSIKELRRRLNKRGTETDDVIEKRLAQAEREIKMAENYDYIMINGELELAVQDLLSVIRSQELKKDNSKYLIDEVLNNA